jgi:peptidoglycan/xylan/chitin deacetylase (PgdA/CDA1 family)
MYHSFSRTPSAGFRDLTVSPEQFGEQLAALRAAAFRFIAVRDVPAALNAADPGARLAAVTIDDGLADGMDAAEVLVAQGLPATYFVPTGFVGATSRWLEAEDASRPILTWQDLSDLGAAGMEIGSHGHAHISADLNREALVRADAARSRELLEERLGTGVPSFAYPFGYQRARSRRAIAAAGFSSACALFGLAARPSDDRLALPRLYVGPDDAPEDLVARCIQRPGPLARWESRQRQHMWTTARIFIGCGPRAARRIRRGASTDPTVQAVPPLGPTR